MLPLLETRARLIFFTFVGLLMPSCVLDLFLLLERFPPMIGECVLAFTAIALTSYALYARSVRNVKKKAAIEAWTDDPSPPDRGFTITPPNVDRHGNLVLSASHSSSSEDEEEESLSKERK